MGEGPLVSSLTKGHSTNSGYRANARGFLFSMLFENKKMHGGGEDARGFLFSMLFENKKMHGGGEDAWRRADTAMPQEGHK